MNSEKINYDDYTLDPNNDVLVPISTYVALTKIMQEVEIKHSKRITTDEYAWYNKVTHQKLSKKSQVKMKPEKLHKEYYENIDMDASSEKPRIDRDDLGRAAIRLLGEFRGIFYHNVDQGNAILRPTPNAPVQEAPVKDDSKEVAGPTLVEDDSKE